MFGIQAKSRKRSVSREFIFFYLKSKIDGCSLKRIGNLPLDLYSKRGLRCIGVPSSMKSSDKILLLNPEGSDPDTHMYVSI